MYKIFLVSVVFVANLMAVWTSIDELPSALKHHHPKYLNSYEAKESVGYPKELAKHPERVINAKIPIVIIDSGFIGLSKFLKDNPDKKSRVKEWITFYKKGKKSTSHHGFDVYKSALIDSPKAEYYLFQIDLSDDNSFYKALEYMKKHKLYMANISFGVAVFYGDDKNYSVNIHKFLQKYQITLFQSIGNERGNAHYFKYSDINNNKALEFIKPTTKKTRSFEFQRLGFLKGKEGTIYLRWHSKDIKDIRDKIDVKLVDKNNKKLPIIIKRYNNALVIKYTSPKDQWVFFQVIDKGIINPKDKYFSLYAKSISVQKMYANGFGISGELALKESPFIVTVGSYGMGKDDKLVPSSFSSYTKTIDGELLPHILGPGQLKFGEKKIQGTSFSSPFISSFYAKYSGYNIKNLVESTSSKRLLSKSLLPIEESRWGVPDVMQVNKSSCFYSDKVENFKSRVEGKNIVLDFDFSRHCMEGLEYKVLVTLNGSKFTSLGVLKIVQKKKYYASKQVRSLSKHIDKNHKIIKIPFADLQDEFGGTKMQPIFYIVTRNTKEPIYLKVKGNFSFKIPLKKEKDPEGFEIFDKAFSSMQKGLNKEAIRLIDKGLSLELFDKDNIDDIVETYALKGTILLRLDDFDKYIEALELFDKADNKTSKKYKFKNRILRHKAALLYGLGDYKKVLEIAKKAESYGIYDVDISVLEYFANKLLKTPKPFRVGTDELSLAIDEYLTKNIDVFKFFNNLGKIKSKNAKEYSRVLWNFILLQNAMFEHKDKKIVFSYARSIISTKYIDSIYYVITKMQFRAYKRLKKVKKQKKEVAKKTSKSMLFQNIRNIKLNGKSWYLDVRFTIKSSLLKDEIVLLLNEAATYLDLPLDKGYYFYQGDKNIDKKLLEFFRRKGDVEELKIEKLTIQ